MNGDALSDLALAAACAWAIARTHRERPALAVAALLLAVTGGVGACRYEGAPWALGPHRFLSLVSACAAIPLLAIGGAWPESVVARRASAATRAAYFLGGLGVGLTMAGFGPVRSILPAGAAFALGVRAARSPSRARVGGGVLLVASLAVSTLAPPGTPIVGPLDGLRAMHLLLAASVVALAMDRVTPGATR